MKSTKEAEAISAIVARLERAKNILIANMTNFCNLKLDVDFSCHLNILYNVYLLAFLKAIR